MSISGSTTNAFNLTLDEVQAHPVEAAHRLLMVSALIDQQKGEILELEAALWLVMGPESIASYQIGLDLLHQRRLDPQARASLIAEYQAWRAKEAANG